MKRSLLQQQQQQQQQPCQQGDITGTFCVSALGLFKGWAILVVEELEGAAVIEVNMPFGLPIFVIELNVTIFLKMSFTLSTFHRNHTLTKLICIFVLLRRDVYA